MPRRDGLFERAVKFAFPERTLRFASIALSAARATSKNAEGPSREPARSTIKNGVGDDEGCGPDFGGGAAVLARGSSIRAEQPAAAWCQFGPGLAERTPTGGLGRSDRALSRSFAIGGHDGVDLSARGRRGGPVGQEQCQPPRRSA